MWELNFNVHDLLTFKIRGEGKMDRTAKLRYSYFLTPDSIEDPDILLNIGSFIPSHENAEHIAHRYFVKDNYFYCKEKGGGTSWEIEILGFEKGKTVVNFSGRNRGLHGIIFPTFMAQEFLIPIFEHKLAEKKHYLIHGGAVCKGNNGYILTGRGGSWKSSLLMDFIRLQNYSLVGDDRIIFRKDGTILSFPRAQFVFDYTLSYNENEDRTAIDNLKILSHIFRGKNEIHPAIPLSKCNHIKKVFFVSRTRGKKVIRTILSPAEGLQKLLLNNAAEYVESTKKSPLGQYYNYTQVYSLIFPENALQKHHARLRDGLCNIVSEISIQGIELPMHYNRTTFSEFDNLMKEDKL